MGSLVFAQQATDRGLERGSITHIDAGVGVRRSNSGQGASCLTSAERRLCVGSQVLIQDQRSGSRFRIVKEKAYWVDQNTGDVGLGPDVLHGRAEHTVRFSADARLIRTIEVFDGFKGLAPGTPVQFCKYIEPILSLSSLSATAWSSLVGSEPVSTESTSSSHSRVVPTSLNMGLARSIISSEESFFHVEVPQIGGALDPTQEIDPMEFQWNPECQQRGQVTYGYIENVWTNSFLYQGQRKEDLPIYEVVSSQRERVVGGQTILINPTTSFHYVVAPLDPYGLTDVYLYHRGVSPRVVPEVISEEAISRYHTDSGRRPLVRNVFSSLQSSDSQQIQFRSEYVLPIYGSRYSNHPGQARSFYDSVIDHCQYFCHREPWCQAVELKSSFDRQWMRCRLFDQSLSQNLFERETSSSHSYTQKAFPFLRVQRDPEPVFRPDDDVSMGSDNFEAQKDPRLETGGYFFWNSYIYNLAPLSSGEYRRLANMGLSQSATNYVPFSQPQGYAMLDPVVFEFTMALGVRSVESPEAFAARFTDMTARGESHFNSDEDLMASQSKVCLDACTAWGQAGPLRNNQGQLITYPEPISGNTLRIVPSVSTSRSSCDLVSLRYDPLANTLTCQLRQRSPTQWNPWPGFDESVREVVQDQSNERGQFYFERRLMGSGPLLNQGWRWRDQFSNIDQLPFCRDDGVDHLSYDLWRLHHRYGSIFDDSSDGSEVYRTFPLIHALYVLDGQPSFIDPFVFYFDKTRSMSRASTEFSTTDFLSRLREQTDHLRAHLEALLDDSHSRTHQRSALHPFVIGLNRTLFLNRTSLMTEYRREPVKPTSVEISFVGPVLSNEASSLEECLNRCRSLDHCRGLEVSFDPADSRRVSCFLYSFEIAPGSQEAIHQMMDRELFSEPLPGQHQTFFAFPEQKNRAFISILFDPEESLPALAR